MLHVLVHYRLVVVVFGILRRRHVDALGDLQTLGRPECIGLVLLGLEAVDIAVVQYRSLCDYDHDDNYNI